MKISILPRVLALAVFFCGAIAAAPAAFAQGKFTPGTGTATNCNPANSPTASFSCMVGNVSVAMTAWGYMGSTNGWKQGLIGDFDANGIGAYTGNKETSSTGQHAFDNLTTGCGTTTASGTGGLSSLNSGCGGSIEALLLNFGTSSVSLTQLGIGWFSGDADISIYQWVGGGTPTPTLGAVTTAGAIAGWTYVGSKDVDNVSKSWTGINSQYSSSFLITTYFGATNSSQGLDKGNDKFKINSFTVACNVNCTPTPTTTTGVPEPASLGLASLGLVAAFGVRRRSKYKPSQVD